MKTGIWQRIKQRARDFKAKAQYVWRISFQRKQIVFPFYQFTKDFRLTESPYLIYCQYEQPTIGNLEQLILRKLDLLPVTEISSFLNYHYTKLPGDPLEFLHYSKGLLEGKIQSMLGEDSQPSVRKYSQANYGKFHAALSWLEYKFQELTNNRLEEAREIIKKLEKENMDLKVRLDELLSISIEFNPTLTDKEVADLFKQLSTLHFADGKPIIITPHRKLSQFLPLICKPFKDKKGTDSLRNYLSGADDKQDRYQLPPEKRRIHILLDNK